MGQRCIAPYMLLLLLLSVVRFPGLCVCVGGGSKGGRAHEMFARGLIEGDCRTQLLGQH